MTERIKLLLVGCGKMGGAILRRTLAAGLIEEAVVIEPTAPQDFIRDYPYVKWLNAREQLDEAFAPDIVLFAVKPQQMPSVLPAYAHLHTAVFLSIAAGITLAGLQTLLQTQQAAIVRSMPNLPASIGAGMSVAVANAHVTATQREYCEQLLSSVGKMEWLNDETLLDSVTALSGSGPAYVFALCEIMAKAGEGLGLAPDMASRLARQTVIGSGALLAQSSESAEALRIAVTSPGGTTQAALKVLFADDAFLKLMREAMDAAVRRTKELAG